MIESKYIHHQVMYNIMFIYLYMFMHVCAQFSSLPGAVLSYFKSRQRVWRETTDPGQAERVALQSKQRRKRSRQARVSCNCLVLP